MEHTLVVCVWCLMKDLYVARIYDVRVTLTYTECPYATLSKALVTNVLKTRQELT